METVAESKDPVMAEDLLRYIMTKEDKELVAAMLYNCYTLIKPDVAMEIGWRSGLQEYVMPYFIQFVKDLSVRVDTVQRSTAEIQKKEEVKAEEEANRPLDMNMNMMFPDMNMNAGPAAIMPAPGSMPPMGGMGMGMGGPPMGAPGMGGMGMQQPPMGGGMPGMGMQPPNMGGF